MPIAACASPHHRNVVNMESVPGRQRAAAAAENSF